MVPSLARLLPAVSVSGVSSQNPHTGLTWNQAAGCRERDTHIHSFELDNNLFTLGVCLSLSKLRVHANKKLKILGLLQLLA